MKDRRSVLPWCWRMYTGRASMSFWQRGTCGGLHVLAAENVTELVIHDTNGVADTHIEHLMEAGSY